MRGWSTEGRFYLGPWGTCSSEAVVGVRVVTQLGCKRQEKSLRKAYRKIALKGRDVCNA